MCTRTGPGTKGIGRMTSKMGLESKVGRMEAISRGAIRTARNTAKVSLLIKGRYQWNDGSVYDGEWQDNKICGFGVYTWTDGRRYEGSWLNNFMHGKGTYSWQDGRSYLGNYEMDKKQGYGVYTWVFSFNFLFFHKIIQFL